MLAVDFRVDKILGYQTRLSSVGMKTTFIIMRSIMIMDLKHIRLLVF